MVRSQRLEAVVAVLMAVDVFVRACVLGIHLFDSVKEGWQMDGE